MALITPQSIKTYKHDVLNSAAEEITHISFKSDDTNTQDNIFETLKSLFTSTITLSPPTGERGRPKVQGSFQQCNPIAINKAASDNNSWVFGDQIFLTYEWSANGSGGTPRVEVWVLHPSTTDTTQWPSNYETVDTLPELEECQRIGLTDALHIACTLHVTTRSVEALLKKHAAVGS